MATLVRRFIGLYDLIPYWLPAALMRFAIGLVFHLSWRTKIDFATWSIKPSTFFLFAQEYKVPVIPPVVATYLATSAELICPLLLWAGLATRFAATALLAMVLVIQLFVYPQAYPEHALWAAGLLMLMRFGPGMLSLDHLIARWHKRG
jgi:putative oxidoreductase